MLKSFNVGTKYKCEKLGKADGTFAAAMRITKYEVESDPWYGDAKYGVCANYVEKEVKVGDAFQLMFCSLFGVNCPSEYY